MRFVQNVKFAWRNLWRNKRRTLITVASIFFGVIFSTLMSSMQEGSYQMYIHTIVNSYSGYMQVQHPDYWADKTVNNTIEYNDTLRILTAKVSDITGVTPRFESFGLASGNEITQGVVVLGIEPKTEDAITQLSSKMVAGQLLRPNDNGVVIGQRLSGLMNLSVGDTLVIISQGYHGVSAAGKYAVKGILKHPSPDLDRSVVYMTLHVAQQLYSAENRITSLVVMVANNAMVEPVAKHIEHIAGRGCVVLTWQKMNAILLKQIESDRAQGYIMKGILFMVVGFGIFGTIMMMIAERKREFGVLMAIGMQKSKLSIVLVYETVLIGILGVMVGFVGSIPVVAYFASHPIQLTGQAADMITQMGFEPIMPFSTDASVFVSQAAVVLIFCVCISVYPVYRISRLKLMDALHK